VAAIPEKVVDDLILRGTMAEIREHVKRYMEAGVDTAFLHLLTAETDPARKQQVLLDATRELSPSAC